MIKFGIIGTNWIAQQFVDAAQASGEYELTTVYSRKMATAEAFGSKNGASQSFDDLTTFSRPGTLTRCILPHQIVCITNKPSKQLQPVRT